MHGQSAIDTAATARRITCGLRHLPAGQTGVARVLRVQKAWSDDHAAACDADSYLSRGASEGAMYSYACLDAPARSRILALTAQGKPD
jgi:uncharacterized protein YecT (DUF1311 family)